MITYKIDVYSKLKEKGYNTTKIRNEKILSESSLQKIRKGEIIGINALDKVCRLLEMQPGNIIKYQQPLSEEKICNKIRSGRNPWSFFIAEK